MQIVLRDIHKHFGPVRANDGIFMSIPAGTIQGLLGENGAGKSTLMKILSGFQVQDSGQIRIDGRPVTFHSPAQAIREGIGMLHQDPLDFPAMCVLDNFLLGRGNRLRQRRAQGREKLLQLAGQFGFPMNPEERLSTLSVGERQQLEILRLVSLGVETLILDEPTTGISTPQRVLLFATLRRLAEEGKTVIFVSHKLEDVESLCHRVTVLRQGRVTGQAEPPFRTENLVQLMFGKELPPARREAIPLGQPVLKLEQATLSGPRFAMPDISLTVQAGEVIGLAGIEGSGQHLFLRACVGLIRPSSGRILLDGHDMREFSYHKLLRNGVAFLPASRLEEGLVEQLTFTEHCLLTNRSQHTPFFIRWPEAKAEAIEKIKEYNIKGTPESAVQSLSGGNQQRALLALLPSSLRLLALEHPTRGLDVESARWVWNHIQQRCRGGTAVLFASADLDEIREQSDRVCVFAGGQMTGPLDTGQTTTEELGTLIAGKEYARAKTAH